MGVHELPSYTDLPFVPFHVATVGDQNQDSPLLPQYPEGLPNPLDLIFSGPREKNRSTVSQGARWNQILSSDFYRGTLKFRVSGLSWWVKSQRGHLPLRFVRKLGRRDLLFLPGALTQVPRGNTYTPFRV